MDNKKAFLMYYEYEEQLKDLSDEELGKLVRAMFRFEKLGFEDENLTPLASMAFGFIKRNLIRDRENYDKRSETSKINGKKGGRPKNEKPKKPNSETYLKPNNLTKPDKEKEKDKDKVKVNDKDNVVVDSITYCEKQFSRTLSPVEYELIMNWRKWFTDDVINYAIDKTIKNGARGLSYTEAIINSWHDKGFKTLHECELENKEDKPEWFDKRIEEEKATDEEMKKMEDLLNEYK